MHDIAELLLSSGANATRTDEFGDTPLDLARRANSRPLVRLIEGKSMRSSALDHRRGGVQKGSAPRYRDKSIAPTQNPKPKI